MAKEPAVVKFGYKQFHMENDKEEAKEGENSKSQRVKWLAACRYCSKVITETRGTTSGFTR